MSQSSVSNLVILSIENELLKNIDFNEVINKFSAVEAIKDKL